MVWVGKAGRPVRLGQGPGTPLRGGGCSLGKEKESEIIRYDSWRGTKIVARKHLF